MACIIPFHGLFHIPLFGGIAYSVVVLIPFHSVWNSVSAKEMRKAMP